MEHAGSYDEAWRRDFERAAREQREAAEQASRAGALTGAPLLCAQRWCETAQGPAPATVGLARCDGNGAWLSCDACAARMLGDARYAVQVVGIDQWRQVSSQREQQIAAQIAAAKTGHGVVSLPASAKQAAGARQQAEQEAARHESEVAGYRQRTLALTRNWVAAAVVSVVLGIIFVIAGAEENGQGYQNVGGNQTPGAFALWVGAVLIVAPVLAGAVWAAVGLIRATARHGRELDARAGLPQAPKTSPLAWILSLLGCLGSVVLGAVIVLAGSDQGGPAGKSTTDLGVFFVVAGLVAGPAWLVAGFLRVTRGQRAAYKRWMASLSPAERAAVYAAQAAAMMAAHQGLRHSNQQARERRAARDARSAKVSGWIAENRRQLQEWQQRASGPAWSQQEPRPRTWRQP